ncbi:MAG TPA: GGDEF domain-containing protein [Candidatus Acidoferrum sp.]|nr:GGDEF domain-containing protein [Candidatus Acidoferrum sp.]
MKSLTTRTKATVTPVVECAWPTGIAVYDRQNFARLFNINLDQPAEAASLDQLIGTLLGGEDKLLWWMFVRASEARNGHEAGVRKLLSTDPLTGVLNGAGFRAWLQSRLHSAKETHKPGVVLSVILIDLVNFKKINDTLSYSIGDEVIKEAVVQLRATLRASDDATIVRFSGDELAIAVTGLTAEAAEGLWRRIHTAQLEKMKYQRSTMLWRRLKRCMQPSGPGACLEVCTEMDESFGDCLASQKRMLCIDGKAVIELADLVMMATGLAHAVVSSQQDYVRLVTRAEFVMKTLKHKYHQRMGGAYRV